MDEKDFNRLFRLLSEYHTLSMERAELLWNRILQKWKELKGEDKR